VRHCGGKKKKGDVNLKSDDEGKKVEKSVGTKTSYFSAWRSLK
jgi:hypothetical protein